jgi:hypothetical protein
VLEGRVNATASSALRPQTGGPKGLSMSTPCFYRGYEIVPRREWSQWCASIYPTRPNLTILVRSTRPSFTKVRLDVSDRAPGFLTLRSPERNTSRGLYRGRWPLRREFSDSQPKWQGDLPELARPGTLFLGTASTGRDIGPCARWLPEARRTGFFFVARFSA